MPLQGRWRRSVVLVLKNFRNIGARQIEPTLFATHTMPRLVKGRAGVSGKNRAARKEGNKRIKELPKQPNSTNLSTKSVVLGSHPGS